jgi:hypothetical protein
MFLYTLILVKFPPPPLIMIAKYGINYCLSAHHLLHGKPPPACLYCRVACTISYILVKCRFLHRWIYRFYPQSTVHSIIRKVTGAAYLKLWYLLPTLGLPTYFNLHCFYVALTFLTFLLQEYLCYDFTCTVIQHWCWELKQTGILSTYLTCMRQISVPFVSLDGLSPSDLTWMFKLLPSKHAETSIWHASQFSSPF